MTEEQWPGEAFARGVVEAVATWANVDPADVWGTTRTSGPCDARHAVWHVLRARGWETHRIGLMFGRNHSTVSSGCGRVQRLLSGGDSLMRNLVAQGERAAYDPTLPPMDVERPEAWVRAHLATLDAEIARAVSARDTLQRHLERLIDDRLYQEALAGGQLLSRAS